MTMDHFSVIRRPIVTEKSTDKKEEFNQVVFEVDTRANKFQIKEAVERIFKVKVMKVRTQQMRGKVRRVGRNFGKKSDWKKAVITLRAGDRIDFFEGV